MVSRESAVCSLLRLAVPAGLALVGVAFGITAERLDAYASSPFPLGATRPYDPATALLRVAPDQGSDLLPAAVEVPVPVAATLSRGQTLETLLEHVGVPSEEAPAVTAVLREHADLRRLHPGDTLTAFIGPAQRPGELELLLRDRGCVRVTASGDGAWSGRFEPFRELRRVRRAGGTVEGSFAAAVVAAGAPEELAYAVADVLQWDLDFTRDLRRGDRFEVLYEEIVVEGRLARVGDVLALTYSSVRAAEPLEAYRAAGGGGYYDRRGLPLAKMFLRSPLRFSRVTSRFSHRRFHPVLRTYRPHYGIDYGAPVGTPVRATAAGTVTFAGWDRGGGGKTVKVRHAKGYVSAYLHLSRFAEGVRPGVRVAQGQVIGRVGSTGLATGPHLDYRVQLHGRWIDPSRIDNVKGDPLTAAELERFLAWRDALRTGLATGEAPPVPESFGEGPRRDGGEVLAARVSAPEDPARAAPGG